MNETVKKRHVREPPSVPFIWEAKPGIPKKDWKPELSSFSQSPKTPLKLIASVPFVWEEKPGIPLPNFSLVSPVHVASSSAYNAATNYSYNHHKDQGNSISDIDNESITSLDLEAFSFDTDESSCSSFPTLFPNCLVSSAKISTAIPLKKNSMSKKECDQLYIPSSPASSEEDGSTSSYATGRSSPTGSAILECLFPLYPPKSGFLERDGQSEKVYSSPLKLKAKEEASYDREDYKCDMLRKPPTLGELIMMSRRRSCTRKASQMNQWDPPKKITRKQPFGCFSIVSNSNMIEGLLKKKYFPRLKLV